MKPKSIGIIGGAGPLAGAFLLDRILKLSCEKYGAFKDADYPKILLISFPFSEMLTDDFDAAAVRRELKECLLFLQKNGASILAIACNTLHAFLEEEVTSLIHIVRPLAEMSLDKPLVLCTSTSTKFALHKHFFPCVYPDMETQKEVDQIIDQILKGKEEIEPLREIIKRQTASKIVLGCTELSLLSAELNIKDKLIIDPLEIMANKIINLSWSKS